MIASPPIRVVRVCLSTTSVLSYFAPALTVIGNAAATVTRKPATNSVALQPIHHHMGWFT